MYIPLKFRVIDCGAFPIEMTSDQNFEIKVMKDTGKHQVPVHDKFWSTHQVLCPITRYTVVGGDGTI